MIHQSKINPIVGNLKIEVRSHFEKEIELKKRIFELEEIIENTGFNLFKLLN